MVTIAWNPTRLHRIRVLLLPSGCKFNSSYYQSQILQPFSEWRSGQAGTAGGTLLVHVHNAVPHTHAAAAASSYHITAIHGREWDGESPSPTLLTGLGIL
jgi:hypothetical protein